MKTIFKAVFNRNTWAYGLFWSWNLIFIAFIFLGMLPLLLPSIIIGIVNDITQAKYLLFLLAIISVPPAASLLGILVLRKDPRKLFAMGYVVEGPLMLLLLVRFFAVRQGNPGLTVLMIAALLGMAAFLWQLLDRRAENRPAWVDFAKLAGVTAMLAVSLYAAVWVALYALPMSVGFVRAVIDIFREIYRALVQLRWQDARDLWQIIWIAPLWLWGFLLFAYTGTLFVLMPIVVPILTVSAWLRSLGNAARHTQQALAGKALAGAFSAAALAALAVGFILANRQPQQPVYALIEKPPATPAEAASLYARQGEIRAGLLNAYLSPFRYVSAVGEVQHIRDLYKEQLNFNEADARKVENFYEVLARPLLYEPMVPPKLTNNRENRTFIEEPRRAAKLYQAIFDQPIIEGERAQVVEAVRNNWDSNQIEAAWQAVADREILLTRQAITITEHSDWAEVELFEAYQNRTGIRQEVVYYFNLPESAVLTGVYLGTTPDRELRTSFVVAPRGAAQQAYKNEVTRNIDPALLEQIGPRQYRLRVYPIEPRAWEPTDRNGEMREREGPTLYLWMTWRTVLQDGRWPLPQLAYRQNVFWTAKSVRTLNGQPFTTGDDEWMPPSAIAQNPGPPTAHRWDFPGGTSVLAEPAASASLPQLPEGLRLAVVLDRSGSMVSHSAAAAAAIDRLRQIPQARLELFQSASAYRGEGPSRQALDGFDAAKVVYFGGQRPGDLLAQFSALAGGDAFDAVIVLTDSGGYELGPGPEALALPAAPVWFVHFDDRLPMGYDDATLEAIQSSGGGVAGSLDEALSRLAVSLDARRRGLTGAQDLVDGYLWTVAPTDLVDQGLTGYTLAIPGILAQTNGGQAGEPGFQTALPGMQAGAALTATAGVSPTFQAVLPGMMANAGAPTPDDASTAFAVRRLTLYEQVIQRRNLDGGDPAVRLAALDQLHAMAKAYGIVTPYSSMIVLVTPGQEKRLEALEQRGDRFNREFEAIGETVPAGLLSGVPEPHEWLLLGLGAILLVWWARRRMRTPRLGLNRAA